MNNVKEYEKKRRNGGWDNPEGETENITTRNGCTCKPEFKYLNDTYKNTCATTILSQHKVCYVDDACGRKDNQGKWWDYCHPEVRSAFAGGDVALWEDNVAAKDLGIHHKVNFSTKYLIRTLIGFVIFIAIFILLVPYLLNTWGMHALLEVYMPNFDLLATAISYDGGPEDTRIFQDLYNPKSRTMIGYVSKLVINYLSLASVAYIVARRTKLTNSVIIGWGIGLVMILLTYLVPNDIISYIQFQISKYLYDEFGWDSNESNLKYYFITLIGIAMASVFILFEKALIAGHEKWLDPIIKELVKIQKGLLELK